MNSTRGHRCTSFAALCGLLFSCSAPAPEPRTDNQDFAPNARRLIMDLLVTEPPGLRFLDPTHQTRVSRLLSASFVRSMAPAVDVRTDDTLVAPGADGLVTDPTSGVPPAVTTWLAWQHGAGVEASTRRLALQTVQRQTNAPGSTFSTLQLLQYAQLTRTSSDVDERLRSLEDTIEARLADLARGRLNCRSRTPADLPSLSIDLRLARYLDLPCDPGPALVRKTGERVDQRVRALRDDARVSPAEVADFDLAVEFGHRDRSRADDVVTWTASLASRLSRDLVDSQHAGRPDVEVAAAAYQVFAVHGLTTGRPGPLLVEESNRIIRWLGKLPDSVTDPDVVSDYHGARAVELLFGTDAMRQLVRRSTLRDGAGTVDGEAAVVMAILADGVPSDTYRAASRQVPLGSARTWAIVARHAARSGGCGNLPDDTWRALVGAAGTELSTRPARLERVYWPAVVVHSAASCGKAGKAGLGSLTIQRDMMPRGADVVLAWQMLAVTCMLGRKLDEAVRTSVSAVTGRATASLAQGRVPPSTASAAMTIYAVLAADRINRQGCGAL